MHGWQMSEKRLNNKGNICEGHSEEYFRASKDKRKRKY